MPSRRRQTLPPPLLLSSCLYSAFHAKDHTRGGERLLASGFRPRPHPSQGHPVPLVSADSYPVTVARQLPTFTGFRFPRRRNCVYYTLSPLPEQGGKRGSGRAAARGRICETHLVNAELRHLMPAALKHGALRVTVTRSFLKNVWRMAQSTTNNLNLRVTVAPFPLCLGAAGNTGKG